MTSSGADRRRRTGGPVRRHPLDLVTAERLFAALDAPSEDRVEGIDGRWMPLVDTLRVAGASATPGELAGEDAAVSAFRAARASVSPLPRRSARRRRRTVALAVLLGAGVATSVAAASDHLPAPVERLADHLLGALGLADDQPSPSPTPPPAVPTTVVGTAPPATAPPATTIAVTAPPSAAVAIGTPPVAPVPGLQPTPTEGAVAPDADAPAAAPAQPAAPADEHATGGEHAEDADGGHGSASPADPPGQVGHPARPGRGLPWTRRDPTRAGAGASGPGQDPARPVSDTARPGAGATGPGQHPARPVSDTARPGRGRRRPGPRRSGGGAARPVAGRTTRPARPGHRPGPGPPGRAGGGHHRLTPRWVRRPADQLATQAAGWSKCPGVVGYAWPELSLMSGL